MIYTNQLSMQCIMTASVFKTLLSHTHPKSTPLIQEFSIFHCPRLKGGKHSAVKKYIQNEVSRRPTVLSFADVSKKAAFQETANCRPSSVETLRALKCRSSLFPTTTIGMLKKLNISKIQISVKNKKLSNQTSGNLITHFLSPRFSIILS